MRDARDEPGRTGGAAPPRRKRSARFVDIAAAAGVSIATVNRVLNERGSVSAEMRARVVAAAKQLGVPRALPDPRHGLTRFDVVFSRSATPFFRRLELALDRMAQMVDARILVHRHQVDPQDEARVAEVLERPGHRRDGLMVALQDTARVREGLRAQVARGVPVVTLMSGIGEVPGLHYAGIDNLAAGRTAGHFIGRLAPPQGRVLLLTHSLRFRAHADRIEGCAALLRERHPGLTVLPAVECLDDPDRCHLAVRQALRAAGPQVVGLYHSGAGAAGIASALAAQAPAQRLAWVGHELSDEHREHLRQGRMDLVIDQDPDGQVAKGLQHLMHAAGYMDAPARDEPTAFRLFSAENLPREAYLDAPLSAAPLLAPLPRGR